MSVPDQREIRPDATSSSLLDLAARGERKAAELIWELYRPLVMDWCRRAGVAAADADDVSQEVLAAVFQGLPAFERQRLGSFRAWIRQITHYKVCDWRRRRASPAVGGTDFQVWLANLAVEATPDPAESAAERAALLRNVAGLLQLEFSAIHWQAFYRAEIESEDAAQVCAHLGLSAGALRVVKSRVRKRLRELTVGLLE